MRVRVFSLVLVVLLVSGTTAMAQNKGSGFKIGVNFSELNADPDIGVTFDRRTGLVAGVFYQFPIAPHFSFQPEWLYSQKGAEVTEEGAHGNLDLDYFDVPLLLRWDSTTAGESVFNVFGGPSINFRHRARSEGDVGMFHGDVDIRSEIERIDFGIVVGAGIEVGHFLIDGRYQFGLKTVNKFADEDEVKLKHRTFSIMGGWRF